MAQSSNAAQQLVDAPSDLSLGQHRLYVDLSKAFVEEMLPSLSGRVFGTVVGLIGAYMSSKAAALLALIPGVGGAASVVKTGVREATAFAVASSNRNVISRVTSKMFSRLATVTPELATSMSKDARMIAFWAVLGVAEDVVADYDYLINIWRRKIKAPNSFFEQAPQIASSLQAFGEAISAPATSDGGGAFQEYITSNRDNLVEFTLTLDELCYDILYLEMVQNYVANDVSVPRGRENPHIFAIQTWIAVLLRHFLLNGISSVTISPAYPFYGWLTGVPRDVRDALNAVAINSMSIRDIMQAMGFTDSETFQSVTTSLLSHSSIAVMNAIEKVTHTNGVLSILTNKTVLGGIKKLTPAALRLQDISE